jgi:hypothetical protein
MNGATRRCRVVLTATLLLAPLAGLMKTIGDFNILVLTLFARSVAL